MCYKRGLPCIVFNLFDTFSNFLTISLALAHVSVKQISNKTCPQTLVVALTPLICVLYCIKGNLYLIRCRISYNCKPGSLFIHLINSVFDPWEINSILYEYKTQQHTTRKYDEILHSSFLDVISNLHDVFALLIP